MSEDRRQASGNAIPTPEELGFDPAETRQKYATERAKHCLLSLLTTSGTGSP